MSDITTHLERLSKTAMDLEIPVLLDAKKEILRLRLALRHYVSECDCNGGTYHEEDHITGKTLVKDCPKCEPARAALEEKE